jgi:hypothetical protein
MFNKGYSRVPQQSQREREGREKGIYGVGHKPYPQANVMTLPCHQKGDCMYRTGVVDYIQNLGSSKAVNSPSGLICPT